MVEHHPTHDRALPWLKRVRLGEFEFFVACHTLAELYAVLTTLPVSPRISPGTARLLIRENVESPAKVISLSVSDYGTVIRRTADLELKGGVVYDALIAKAAQKARVDLVLTLNPKNVKRVWPRRCIHGTLPMTAIHLGLPRLRSILYP